MGCEWNRRGAEQGYEQDRYEEYNIEIMFKVDVVQDSVPTEPEHEIQQLCSKKY